MSNIMAEEDMTMVEAADEGRGGDTILAHLTPGELVVPVPLLSNPEFQQTMSQYFEENQLNISQYIVGDEANSINPETGHPEFGWLSDKWKSVTSWVDDSLLAPVAGFTGINELSPQVQEEKEIAEARAAYEEDKRKFTHGLESSNALERMESERSLRLLEKDHKKKTKEIKATYLTGSAKSKEKFESDLQALSEQERGDKIPSASFDKAKFKARRRKAINTGIVKPLQSRGLSKTRTTQERRPK